MCLRVVRIRLTLDSSEPYCRLGDRLRHRLSAQPCGLFNIRCEMQDDDPMRTTLEIDDDILQAAKEIASSRATTAGRVISDQARKSLEPKRSPRVRNGVPLLPRRPKGSRRPTMAFVNKLRDEE